MNFFGTFHSVARTLLSTVLNVEKLGYTKSFSIADTDEILEVYDRVIRENKLSVKYRNKINKRIQQYKQGKILYGNMKQDDDLEAFFGLLKQEKVRCNIMEFDDLIEYALTLLPESEFCPQWIIIDEFQDCDEKQLEMISYMQKGRSHLFAVGDPNQVIYTWRGSHTNLFEVYKKKYHAREIALPINYRSTTTILDAAKAFLGMGQNLEGIRESGHPILIKKHHNAFNEAVYLADKIKKLHEEGVAYSDIAVFYRKQKQSDVFRDVFTNKQIPFEISLRKNLRDIPVLYWLVRLLKASANTKDKDSILYVLRENRYGPGFSTKMSDEALQYFATEEKPPYPLVEKIRGFKKWCEEAVTGDISCTEAVFDYFDLNLYLMPTSITYTEDKETATHFLEEIDVYIKEKQKKLFEGIKDFVGNAALYGSQILTESIHEDRDSVKLMTLHASKGLEFKYVFISGVNLGVIPLPNKGPDEEEEEKRLFFVGITRARDFLEISYHGKPEDFGAYGIPSPFLRMIPEALVESDELGSRAASLTQLRREIKANIDSKLHQGVLEQEGERRKETKPEEAEAPKAEEAGEKQEKWVYHDKYGKGKITAEDVDNITIDFEVYGEKVFSKMFCPLKYL